MTEADGEEFDLVQRAKSIMDADGVDWVALATNHSQRKNRALADNICNWYQMASVPCTQTAIEKSGRLLTTAEYRECIPRPNASAGIIIAVPKHPLMAAYMEGWLASDGKRLNTLRKEVLKLVEYGVLSADQATLALEWKE